MPPPLAIGSVQLESGAWVKGFVCEPAALAGAQELPNPGKATDVAYDYSGRDGSRNAQTNVKNVNVEVQTRCLTRIPGCDPVNAVVVTETATVARYQQDAAADVERIAAAGAVPVIVGGSMMYIQALLDAIVRAKPATSKGTYLKKICLSTTMGPGIRIDPSSCVTAQAA